MLTAEIENAKRAVTTDTVSITVGEVSNMYDSSELNILPEFQRLFRWEIDQKSSFIESILMGIPIPPAFVYENEGGSWELIDGLQRISTILEFMGKLRDPDHPGEMRRSVLASTQYLPSLKDVVWDKNSETEVPLHTAAKLFFRRHRIDFQILKHPSDPNTKYDLFQRLNRGGAYANEQEVRTCSMVLANSDITRKMRQICRKEAFQGIFRITDEQKKNQRDLEYLVRLCAHSRYDIGTGEDVQIFLDTAIIKILGDENANAIVDDADWAVSEIFRISGPNALIPTSEAAQAGELAPRFTLRALEAIVVGIIKNKAAIAALPHKDSFIRDKITNFWSQPQVADMSTAGRRGTDRLKRTIPFGEEWFRSNA